jgi:hypothetical protein
MKYVKKYVEFYFRGEMFAAAHVFKNHRGAGEIFIIPARRRQLFWEESHEFAQNFGFHICYTVRLNVFDRLAAVVPVQTSHSLENRNIFLNTIAAAADFQPRWTSTS